MILLLEEFLLFLFIFCFINRMEAPFWLQNDLQDHGNGSTCGSWDPKKGLTSCKIMMMYQKNEKEASTRARGTINV